MELFEENLQIVIGRKRDERVEVVERELVLETERIADVKGSFHMG